jgi:hypothetical protein
MNKGSVMETTSYNEKGKIQTVNTITIKDIERGSDEVKLSIHAEIKDEKGKDVTTAEYDAHCKGNTFSINMKSMVSPEQYKAWEEMTVSMDADDINYPTNLTVGQKLDDAHLKVTITMSGMNMPGTTIDITERVVQGMETVTTPAGTFDCVKISSKVKVKSIIGIEMNSVEWLSKGNGVIRTESYKGDKLKGYSEMTKLTK